MRLDMYIMVERWGGGGINGLNGIYLVEVAYNQINSYTDDKLMMMIERVLGGDDGDVGRDDGWGNEGR